MSRVRKLAAGERGSVTVEAAVATAVLVAVFGLLAGGAAGLAGYLAAVHEAGAAARAHAIGAPVDPGRVAIAESGGGVTATVPVPTLAGTLEASARFPSER